MHAFILNKSDLELQLTVTNQTNVILLFAISSVIKINRIETKASVQLIQTQYSSSQLSILIYSTFLLQQIHTEHKHSIDQLFLRSQTQINHNHMGGPPKGIIRIRTVLNLWLLFLNNEFYVSYEDQMF